MCCTACDLGEGIFNYAIEAIYIYTNIYIYIQKQLPKRASCMLMYATKHFGSIFLLSPACKVLQTEIFWSAHVQDTDVKTQTLGQPSPMAVKLAFVLVLLFLRSRAGASPFL